MSDRPSLTDLDIRVALRPRVLQPHLGDPDTVLIEELGVCRGLARVDLAVVNGTIEGYEIKSDRDSLRRLEGQVDLFSKVLDRAVLVASPRHLDEALNIVPAWWGVLRVQGDLDGAVNFKVVRRGRKNRSREARALVELLWMDEAVALLERHGHARGVRGKPRAQVWDRICDTLDIELIAAEVRESLKARAAQRVVPPSA